MLELVTALESASTEDSANALPYMLVAESGANIHRAFAATAEAADKIDVVEPS